MRTRSESAATCAPGAVTLGLVAAALLAASVLADDCMALAGVNSVRTVDADLVTVQPSLDRGNGVGDGAGHGAGDGAGHGVGYRVGRGVGHSVSHNSGGAGDGVAR
jgi:hypothetical protein